MRRFLIVVLVALVLVGSCKAQLDKVKVAGLLAGYVIDYATGNEIDLSAASEVAEDLALGFVDAYADEIPARYRAETVAFVKSVIPKLIADWGARIGDGKVVMLGPQGEDSSGYEESLAAYLLSEFEAFHDEYREGQ